MKILYGITKSNFGGAQRYVFELAVKARDENHNVAVLCGQEGKLVEMLKKEKIKTITLNNLERDISIIKEVKSFIDIVKILKEERPDVFHVNSSKMGGLGVIVGRLTGIKKIIFTGHGWAFNEPRPVWQKNIIKFAVWMTILLSHKTICVSEKTRKDIKGWPFIKKKLNLIYNGTSEFDIVKRNDKTFTVGVISELHKIKGLDILLLAWKKFVVKYEAKLILIGTGEERKNLENMARNLGISDSVIFMGFIENARTLLSNFDIFCIPSRSEALPYVILEAGLARLPVIATPVGGIPEIIESGRNGVLVPVENDEILFSTLILLAEDKELRERLGTNLKSSIEENFSFEQMVTKTFSLY